MSEAPLHERIVEQFSYGGRRSDVWRAFDRVLETDAYLNLGFTPRYLPLFVGSSQRRLAGVVGRGLARRLDATRDVPLLDVGCGRGGPAAVLAQSHGFDVVGVDLVPYNVAAARRNATRAGVDAGLAVGDAASLPIATDAVAAATAMDALVYVPDGHAVFAELARVLRPGGVVAITDLLAEDDVDAAARASLDAFAAAWDMSEVVPVGGYLDDLAAAGFVIEQVRDLGPHSVDRFRKWTRLYLAVARRRPGLVASVLDRWNVDADRVTEQVRATNEALSHLRHVLVYARRAEGHGGNRRRARSGGRCRPDRPS